MDRSVTIGAGNDPIANRDVTEKTGEVDEPLVILDGSAHAALRALQLNIAATVRARLIG